MLFLTYKYVTNSYDFGDILAQYVVSGTTMDVYN
jgi:hypothetical protein